MVSRRTALKTGLAAALAVGAGAATDQRAASREAGFEARFPPEGRFLDVGGTPVHVVIRGRGPDLVMLHGASGNSRDFTFDLIPRLEDRFRCIAFDRPGLGYTGRADPAYDSAWTSAAESPEEQAALLARAYAMIASGDAPLVLGHSFGGTCALAWGLDHPARALILLGAPAMRWPGGLGPLYRINGSTLGGALAVPLLSALVPESRIASATTGIFAPDPVPDGYLDHVGGQLILRRASLRANSRQVNNLKPLITEMSKRYADGLRMPIEWLHGEADTIVPAAIHAHPFKELVPDTNLTILPGVGHMPHHAAPDEVTRAIDRANGAA